MIFNYNNAIIGQSWVWYDEYSKTICLDNIEVLERFHGLVKKNDNIRKSFIKCLITVSNGFKSAMSEKGLEVEHVTIGRGYNDIK